MENTFFQDYTKLTASIKALAKDENNPFFKSKFISLSSILEEAKRVCLENNFIFLQTPTMKDGKEILITELRHIAGEKISCEMPLVRKEQDDPQKLGASLTYMRRYSLTSILGIQEADDDGNMASSTTKKYTLKKPIQKDNRKITIADLIDKIAGVPFSTKEEYEKECRKLTQLDLTEKNYDEIISRLTALQAERGAK